MPAERFDFPNAHGQKLSALLDRPGEEPRAYALFAHCFTCGKDIRAAKRIADGLTALGIAVLRFDFTGLGSSEGEFANTTFSSNIADLVAAANELRRRARAPASRPLPIALLSPALTVTTTAPFLATLPLMLMGADPALPRLPLVMRTG